MGGGGCGNGVAANTSGQGADSGADMSSVSERNRVIDDGGYDRTGGGDALVGVPVGDGAGVGGATDGSARSDVIVKTGDLPCERAFQVNGLHACQSTLA